MNTNGEDPFKKSLSHIENFQKKMEKLPGIFHYNWAFEDQISQMFFHSSNVANMRQPSVESPFEFHFKL